MKARASYVAQRYRGLALLRAAYWYLVRRYDSEVCRSCGRPVAVVWTAPTPMWNEVIAGDPNASGEGVGGIRCPACFDREYRSLQGESLRWVPRPLEAPIDLEAGR